MRCDCPDSKGEGLGPNSQSLNTGKKETESRSPTVNEVLAWHVGTVLLLFSVLFSSTTVFCFLGEGESHLH